MKPRILLAITVLLFLAHAVGNTQIVPPKAKQPELAPRQDGFDGIYLIMYKKEIFSDGKTKNGETLEQLCKRHAKEFKGQVVHVLQVINGCSMQISTEDAAKLAKQPEVKAIEKNQRSKIQ